MNIGMLWFDNDPKAEMTKKIERAASYYRQKYGKAPNVCFIHPSMLKIENIESPPKIVKAGGIEVRTSGSVLPNHFWIGVNGSHAANET
ncbi:MAG: hypothetical protein JW908_03110 [Anaerolineales bacterium]|nr:hypothetical protein [Anaerolineales bacterium]